MPIYILYAKDKPGSLERRLEHYAAHRAFIEAQGEIGSVSVVVSGPLQTENGEAMTGSMILVNAPTRGAVDQFAAQDPFMREGVWGEVSITRFHCRYASERQLDAIL